MSRPCHQRRICRDLEARVFKPRGIPSGELEQEALPLDGLEALRLADIEGLYQEEAARRMGVSRATFARVLASARRTVALALVEGRALEIGGGTVQRTSTKADRGPCPVHGSERRGRRCRCRHRGGHGHE